MTPSPLINGGSGALLTGSECSGMSIEQTRTCKKCQRENPHEDRFCAQCGADLTPTSWRSFIIALGLTALPFLVTPFLLAPDFDDSGESFGDVIFILLATLMMGVYLAVGGIVAALFHWRQRRSVARGVLIGLGVGLLLGIGSCTVSGQLHFS